METPRDVVTADRQVAQPVVPEPIAGLPATALETLTRSELDVQITTARRYPRSLALFKAHALSMVRLDKETAASCFYALPRRQRQDDGTWKKVTITGPSVRLAEIVASAWGNLRAGARTIAETQTEVVAQGYAHDLEVNNARMMEVQRRIVTSEGRRYSDDLVTLTKNAACAIAYRNAIFAVVPRAFVNPLVQVAMKVAVGDAQTLAENRRAALAAFGELGVSAPQVCAKLERAGVEDLDLEDLVLLSGLLTGIRDGETTIAIEFPPPEGAAVPAGSRSAALAETVQRRRRGGEERAAAGGGRGPEPPATPAAGTPETPKTAGPATEKSEP